MMYYIELYIETIRFYELNEKNEKETILLDKLSDHFKERGGVVRFRLPFVPMAGDEILLSEVELLGRDWNPIKRNNQDFQLHHINVFVTNRSYLFFEEKPEAIIVNASMHVPSKGNWITNKILSMEDFVTNSPGWNFYKLLNK